MYVSGSADKMPQDVWNAVEWIACKHGAMSEQEAQKFVRQLELSGRYVVEAWS